MNINFKNFFPKTYLQARSNSIKQRQTIIKMNEALQSKIYRTTNGGVKQNIRSKKRVR